MRITVTTTEAQKGFYPTPPALAEMLLSGIDWAFVKSVLEPSAGKGNLVSAIAGKHAIRRWDNPAIDIDCVEFDPALRGILTDQFSERYEKVLSDRLSELDKKKEYDYELRKRKELSQEEKAEEIMLQEEIRKLKAVNVRIVHDDFLSFETRKSYDLIVMNPPFSDGDSHLLKAISLVEPHGGKIRCLLNAQTLRNPCTSRRKLLMQKLEEYRAEISYETGAFADAERPTGVEVAIIKIDIPVPKYENDPQSLYNQLKAAASIPESDPEVTDLSIGDFLQSIVAQFNFEVDAGLRLIREYRAMRPYLLASLSKDVSYNYPTLNLCVGDTGSYSSDRGLPDSNRYVELVRNKYWRALFSNEKFIGKLTSNLREKYFNMVGELIHYDFSMFNIQRILAEMNAEMSQGVVDTILDLFEKLTVNHSWYPECSKNIHYFNGWKTNKAHRINKKVILPVYGLFYDYARSEAFRAYEAYKVLGDIEKALNYLDGNMTAEVSLEWILNTAAQSGQTKNISCKFFDVTFYKKGTCHITFTNMELLDRFNIYCARQRGWLPPNYGSTRYGNMTEEERTVVDSFHGDDTPGTGEKAYTKVCDRASYYLAPANQQKLALNGMPA